MRKIIIKGNDDELKKSKKIINKLKNEFNKRNVFVEYRSAKNFQAVLIGYDGDIKSTTTKIDRIPLFLNKIDQMPMGRQERLLRKEKFQVERRESREKLLEKCGLPNNEKTSHCFADSTHHTCCMLGPKARAYADSSGNPIGITSENAFENRYGRKAKKNEKTSWCTCTGSKVCSYYQKKFPNDGTHIKFIGNTNTKNEDEGIKKMNIMRHRTPGVN